MTLILKNEQMEALIPMRELIEGMEIAFRDLGNRQAFSTPRSDLLCPAPSEERDSIIFNEMHGVVPSLGVGALRFYFSSARLRDYGDGPRWETPGDYTGLVLLFDIATCRTLAITDDHAHSTVRVAATSAVAAKYLARRDAKIMGLFGTGEQAKAQAMAIPHVRRLEEIRVYSPNAEHRRAFAREMEPRVGVAIRPVDRPGDAVKGAHLVHCATSSQIPVFDGNLLEQGTHVDLIQPGGFHGTPGTGGEVDPATYQRANVIVANTRRQIEISQQGFLYGLLSQGQLSWSRIGELGELVAGKFPGRVSDAQITVSCNNHGLGIQFAVSAKLAFDAARKRKIGTDLPEELFFTDRRGGLWVA